MKNQKFASLGIAVVALAIAACMGLASCGPNSSTSLSSNDSSSSSSAAKAEMTIKVDIASNEQYKVEAASENVTIPEGGTALDALQATAFKVVTQNGQYGAYVTSINDVEAGKTTGWSFSVNGEQPTVGAGEYKLKANDVVIWAFMEF